MMGNIIKHELKDTLRIIPWLFLATALFGLIALILSWIDVPVMKYFSQTLLILAGAATFVLVYVIIVLRFYRSMFGAEGYLTQTLPVSASKLVLAKYVSGVIWVTLATLVMLAAILGSSLLMTGTSFQDFWAMISQPIELPLDDGSTFTISSLLSLISPLLIVMGISALYVMAQIYLAITLASTPPFNGSPVLAIPYFLVINFVAQMIDGLLMFLLPLQIMIGDIGNGWTLEFEPMIAWVFSEDYSSIGFGISFLFFEIAATVGILVLITWLVKNRVNIK
jgi:hypothetical protein